jgi:DNA end-binding protein Ku
MSRAIKSTYIKFGLINIPIKLTSLTLSEKGFTLVCPEGHRIRYKRWCSECNREIQYSELKKAYEISKSNLVILTKEQLESIKIIEEDTGIEIIGFTNRDDIPFYLYEKTYNVIPIYDKKIDSRKQFVLFREALKLSGLTAIGKMVMRNKSYLVAITSYQDRLFLSLLTYPEKLRVEEKVDYKISEAELNLAIELIKNLNRINWSEYYNENNVKDEYREKLQQIILNNLTITEKTENKVVVETSDLQKLLEKSIEIMKKKQIEQKQ